ncbi:dihydrolipoamide acetyltransferase family protein [Oceanicoccus sp. KOV_DT_Chl]|uniref:dihydrolipoamide acetyltransferase family protein n=1 Tax=Oceanicoccus sp. KOV_DT_Chl TaxID=1904639 RepID=UPI000C7BEE4A|nr:dihydrolipoamide acetyltransferase family protein [Oceanicoccus sp. KOV_DT_Chl]
MTEFSFKLPDLGEGIVESEVCQWYIQVGDEVTQDQHIADIQTDKAVIETSSPVNGKVLKLGCDAGEVLAVGSQLVLFEITDSSKVSADTEQLTVKPVANTSNSSTTIEPQDQNIERHDHNSDGTTILTSPSVRLRARQENIDLQQLSGTGPKGRITHNDLDAATGNNNVSPKQQENIIADKKAKNTDSNDILKQYPLTGTRRVIAKKIQHSAQQIPQYTYIEEVDVTKLEQHRHQLNQQQSQKLTLLPFIVQALSKTLPQFPHCNAHFDNDNNQVTEFKAVHIGIATMTDSGLMVPVIRHAQNLSLWQCAEQIEQLATGARHNQLTTQQLSGSTITITSLGKLGGIASTPIINAPETCIIGINKIQQRPVVIDNGIAIRSMMNISATFDHRIVDGFDGASLVLEVKNLLEHPTTLTEIAP